MSRQDRSPGAGFRSRSRPLLLVLLLSTVVLSGSAGAQRPGSFRATTWLADWDLDAGWREWRANAGVFDELHLFGAYFDSNLDLVVPGPWLRLVPELRGWRDAGNGRSLWMTVVNDYLSEGATIQKDPYVVQSLVLTPERRQRHIAGLVALAREYGVDGIELDYEQVLPEDWPAYLRLVEEAAAALGSAGIQLHVVLQPTEFQLRNAPDAAPRTVMSYNLHGMHSGPGPRNTPDLVRRIAAWIGAVGIRDYRIAMATGGFEWIGDTPVRSMREADAIELRRAHGAALERTEQDNGYFLYTDDQGRAHEVWFEDASSVRRQWDEARRAGFSELAIWRLGGNSPDLFEFLRQEREGATTRR